MYKQSNDYVNYHLPAGLLLATLGGTGGAFVSKKNRLRNALIGMLGLPAAYAAYLYGTRNMEGNAFDQAMNEFNNRAHAWIDPIKDDKTKVSPAIAVGKLKVKPNVELPKAKGDEFMPYEDFNPDIYIRNGDKYVNPEGKSLHVANKYKDKPWIPSKNRPYLKENWDKYTPYLVTKITSEDDDSYTGNYTKGYPIADGIEVSQRYKFSKDKPKKKETK